MSSSYKTQKWERKKWFEFTETERQINFEKEDVYQTINKITFTKEDVQIFEVEVELTEDLFTLKGPLQAYVDLNAKGPSEDIEGVHYNEPIIISIRDKVIRNLVIYLVVVMVAYYFIFVKQPKTLGKDKMSQGLKKDVDKLNNAKDSDISV